MPLGTLALKMVYANMHTARLPEADGVGRHLGLGQEAAERLWQEVVVKKLQGEASDSDKERSSAICLDFGD